MVRYFYLWTPLVIVGTVVLLSAPWLGLIALTIVSLVSLVALVALAALTWATVAAPYLLIRSLDRRWREHAATRTPRAVFTGRQGAGAR
jgi:hypothetical protein